MPMQVVTNALRVVECVITQQPVGVSEIARQLDLPKSSVQRSLEVLQRNGWLKRDRTNPRQWIQTPRIWTLAHAGPGLEIRELTWEVQHWLNEKTDESIHVTHQEGDSIVVIDRVESTKSIRVFDPIGTTVPMHLSGSGRALLASWDRSDLQAYIDRQVAALPSERRPEPEQLLAEVDEIRARGFSVNRGSWRSEISGVGIALPLAGPGNPAEYGLAIAVPSHRFEEDNVVHYGELVEEARDRILAAAGLRPMT
ncbi:IclR family transcriptional regulator [Citricoccus sp.]|uniref:IclR family transcriptional regulator n=1 Tax=Citricoccus sp. TaxID=1978372 RepID=UPI0028BE1DA7|nr:IclR family transcriptional regulator [Citricoccus sp.]